MPILSSIAGAAAKAYGLMSNALKIITDSFNRSNGSLGTTDTGQSWNATRGTWSISSNQATSSDSASTYPMATVDISAQNVTVSADITDGGPGIAFWVTDANSWWASSANYRTSSYSYSCCGGSTGASNVGCGSTTVYTCGASYTQSSPTGCSGQTITTTIYNARSGGCGCYETGIQSGGQCIDNSTLQVLGPLCCGFSGGSSTDVGCGVYSTTTETLYQPRNASTVYYQLTTCSGTNYHTELKLYKNVSGTISTVATHELNSNTSSYSEINSIKAITSGDSITVSGYSSSGLSSQLGSNLTNTPSSPTKGSKVGIIKTPSDANSGSILDNFSAQNVL